jgi:radical SAM protein with 4Fe4S-binding SPASM domain
MTRLGVRADGVMVPCILISSIELGRVNQDDLQEVWQKHPELNKLRERRRIPLNAFEFCRGCEYTNYCSGGCPATAYEIEGDQNHPSPDACLRRFLAQGGKLPDQKWLMASDQELIDAR